MTLLLRILLSLISFPLLLGLAIAFGGVGTPFDLELGTWSLKEGRTIRIEGPTLSYRDLPVFSAKSLLLEAPGHEVALNIELQQAELHFRKDEAGHLRLGPHLVLESGGSSALPELLAEIRVLDSALWIHSEDGASATEILGHIQSTIRFQHGRPVSFSLQGEEPSGGTLRLESGPPLADMKHRVSLKLDHFDLHILSDFLNGAGSTMSEKIISGELTADYEMAGTKDPAWLISSLLIKALEVRGRSEEESIVQLSHMDIGTLSIDGQSDRIDLKDLALEEIKMGNLSMGKVSLRALSFGRQHHHFHLEEIEIQHLSRNSLRIGILGIPEIIRDTQEDMIRIPEMTISELSGRLFETPEIRMTGIEYHPNGGIFTVVEAEAPSLGGSFVTFGATHARGLWFDHETEQLRIGEIHYEHAKTPRFECRQGTSHDISWRSEEDLLEIAMTHMEEPMIGSVRARILKAEGARVVHARHQASLRHLELNGVQQGSPAEKGDHRVDTLVLSDFFTDWEESHWRTQEILVLHPELILERDHSGPGFWKGLDFRSGQDDASHTPAASWHYAIGRLRVEHGELTLKRSDNGGSDLAFRDLSLIADDLDRNAADDIDLTLDARSGSRGSLHLTGRVRQTPLSGVLNFELKGLRIRNFREVLGEFTGLDLRRGHLGMTGSLRIQPEVPPRFEFDGDATIEGLEAYLPDSEQGVLGWQKLTLDDISWSSKPRHFAIRVLDFEGANLNLEVGVDHQAKLLGALAPKNPSPEPSDEKPGILKENDPGELPSASIGLVRFRNSRLDFTDRSLKPDLIATVRNLDGTFHGLSTRKNAVATVNLEGRLNRDSPMRIYGHVRPLDYRSDTDLSLDFHGLDLTSFDQYAGEFSGYRIERGKLSLDLHYQLRDDQLMVEDQAVLDRLTLGEKKEAKGNLLVDLAIWLLKDSHGNLDLDLPVNGDLQNPSYQLADLYLAALRSIPLKFFYTPFGLIDDFIPNVELDASIDFKPGNHEPMDPAAKSLAPLVAAYMSNEGGVFEIQPASDPKLDRAALAGDEISARIERLQRQEQRQMGRKDSGSSQDHLDDGTRGRFLGTILETSQSKLMSHDPKDPGTAELIARNPLQYALDHWNVDEDEVRRLGFERAQAIRDILIRSYEIPPDAIFLRPSNVGEGPDPIPVHVHYSSD